MNAEPYLLEKKLFCEALEREPQERAAYLARACPDEGLRSKVLSLVAEHERARSFLASSGPGLELGAAAAGPPLEELLPERMGSFRVVKPLGRGGMGVVYEAEQDKPVQRRAAVKIIDPRWLTPETVRRFDSECRALGRLEHPGIARIYASGTQDLGRGLQPWLAMEFVQGQDLLSYAQGHGLSIRQRLALFADIVDAVHHAHQRGVIHRDLKPDNILVTLGGQPKILDFGVARLVAGNSGEEPPAATRLTIAGTPHPGTPAYMSPEQAAGDPDLDVRSDIYSLGVVLYELVSGRLPYEVPPRLTLEAARIIRESQPPRLGRLNRQLRGDIEAIAGKALEKDRGRRYSTAHDLAEDVRHFLHHEPVIARRPSAIYNLRKFERRHRALVGGAAATVAALVLGLAGTLHGLSQARQEAEGAKLTLGFLRNMLTSPDPGQLGRSATVLELIERENADIDAEFADRPDIAATVRLMLGQMYTGLGEYEKAQALIEDAHEALAVLASPSSPITAEAATSLAEVALAQGRFEDTEALAGDAVAILETQADHEFERLASAQNVLGQLFVTLEWKEPENTTKAEAFFQRALTLCTAHPTTSPLITAAALGGLADVSFWQRKATRGLDYAERAYELLQTNLGADHPETARAMQHLALFARETDDDERADRLYTQSIEQTRSNYGSDHPVYAQALNACGEDQRACAAALALSGENELALEHYARGRLLLEEALAIRRSKLGDDHFATAETMNNLATLLFRIGEFSQAGDLMREALPLYRRVRGQYAPMTRLATINLITCLWYSNGELREARPLALEWIDAVRATSGWTDGALFEPIETLYKIEDKLGSYSVELEQLCQEAAEISRRLPTADEGMPHIICRWARVVMLRGRPADATQIVAEVLTTDNLDMRLGAQQVYAECLCQLNRFSDAEEFLLHAIDAWGDDRQHAAGLDYKILQVYDDWHAAEPRNGHDAKAADWRAHVEEMKARETQANAP